MTAPRPLCIVTLVGRSLAEARAELFIAAAAGADIAELRLDRWTPAERTQIGQLFPAPLSLLATLRSRTEGGEGPEESADRSHSLRALLAYPFEYLDLEIRRDQALIAELNQATAHRPILVLSAHLPPDAGAAEVAALLERNGTQRTVVKVVVPSDFTRFWTELLPQVLRASAGPPYIVHTTGPTGPLLRIWARRFRMYAVFAGPPRPVASPGAVRPVEPAQIPVDRVRAFVGAPDPAGLYAVVGHPISHSLSPDIHSFWIAAEGRTGLYVPLDFPTEAELAMSLGPLSEGGFRGLSVTHPWKFAALALAVRASRVAETAGCANTLTVEPDGWVAENTDVAAVARRLRELRSARVWDGARMTILGSGGSARAALVAARLVGCTADLLARRQGPAERLAREFGAELVGPSPTRPASLVIHATPAGREEVSTLELPWHEFVGPSTYVLDFVYRPASPFLAREVLARGGRYEDGLRLLVYQAAESYALWWGASPAERLQERALRGVACAA